MGRTALGRRRQDEAHHSLQSPLRLFRLRISCVNGGVAPAAQAASGWRRRLLPLLAARSACVCGGRGVALERTVTHPLNKEVVRLLNLAEAVLRAGGLGHVGVVPGAGVGTVEAALM